MDRIFVAGKIGMMIGNILGIYRSCHPTTYGVVLSECNADDLSKISQRHALDLKYIQIGNMDKFIVIRIKEDRIFIYPKQEEDRKFNFVVSDTVNGFVGALHTWDELDHYLSTLLLTYGVIY